MIEGDPWSHWRLTSLGRSVRTSCRAGSARAAWARCTSAGPPTGTLAAVKLVHSRFAADPSFRQRFAREMARALDATAITHLYVVPLNASDASVVRAISLT
jgi:hypothetical protein